jgi:hypothetical protein
LLGSGMVSIDVIANVGGQLTCDRNTDDHEEDTNHQDTSRFIKTG